MPEFYALVPAAGTGSRMGSERPKQYLPLAGRPMIYHAVRALAASPDIATVFVVLAPNDTTFHEYDWSEFGSRLQPLYCGGAMRAESVLNGLMAAELEPDDWVLVHDAARPCLSRAEIARLIYEVKDDEVGGILAVPLADTLKRAGENNRIARTEDRSRLWRAQTPQMFRAGLLQMALMAAREVTDEASAVEAMGLHPKLVEGSAANFKVTYPEDVKLAEWLLGEK
jgi:2-C-methyl-D-erythritol 4-phosphate cytidylyltransferase